MKLDTNKLLFSQKNFYDLLQNDPLVLIDGGARGDLPLPWNLIPHPYIQVIGFEPDEEACRELNKSLSLQSNFKFYPYALWNTKGSIPFHIAKTPSCSSVYPPNEEILNDFPHQGASPRLTDRKTVVSTVTLDELQIEQKVYPDFIKLDTHGAEWEILQGACETLNNGVLGVLVETWCTEVHKGQKLSGDVLSTLHEIGFELFDVRTAAAWQRASNQSQRLGSKSQIIGLDLLFFKKPSQKAPLSKYLKAAAIAEVYGFRDYAYELLNVTEHTPPEWHTFLKEAQLNLIQNARNRHSTWERLKRKLCMWLRMPTTVQYAPLH